MDFDPIFRAYLATGFPMGHFLEFVEQMPIWQRLVWVTLCLGASWLLEEAAPLVRFRDGKWRHDGVNAVFLGTTLVVNTLIGIAAVATSAWVAKARFGLLSLLSWPPWLDLILALLLLDFMAQYAAHWLLHQVRWMWRFHVVHHSDTMVDATTGARLHPGDFALREAFALIAIVLGGIPLAYYLLYRLITIAFTFVTHANVSPPPRLDALLSLVFVTPNMHKVHHHHRRPWTDSNYGGILSIWDRLFGTFVAADPATIRYGVDVGDASRSGDLGYQMGLPFTRSEPLTRPRE